ncbi:hypothetical protein [Hydrogenophaga aquatica]
MTIYAYNPTTGELIRTDTVADWMGSTDVPPPDFDPVAAGCFWRDDRWEVVAAQPPAVPVPVAVTMRQARLALLGAGLLAQVNAAIAAMAGAEGEAARIEWEYAQEVRRDSPLVAGLSAALGLTDETLDNLYRAAAGL